MTRYNISYKFSRNGTSWSMSSTFVIANSPDEAIKEVKSMYPYVSNVKIIGQRPA